MVFFAGILTSLGPCNVATIPLIIGYVGGSQHVSRWRSFVLFFTFALGLAITFMSLGIAAALIGNVIAPTMRWWYYLIAGVCFIVGLQMLGVLNFNMPMWFGGLREKINLRGMLGALILGLVSGLVASQCATPVLAAILTIVMAKGEIAYGAMLLFVYALGRGVPIVLVGTFTGALKNMRMLNQWMPIIDKISGVVVLFVGLYFLWIA